MNQNNWQRRWQPLLEEWVVIASTTGQRPWCGAELEQKESKKPIHDPSCYLCPGTSRSNQVQNPHYEGPWAFDNDFPSLSFKAPPTDGGDSPLHRTAPAQGVCRVLCWHPRHDLTLASLAPGDMTKVVGLLQQEFRSIQQIEAVEHVLMFENKGTEIGVSNPHPHGQIYGTTFVPRQIETMRQAQHRYFLETKSKLLMDLAEDAVARDCLVHETTYFRAFVPFAARFPYESWIVPKVSLASLGDFSDDHLQDLGLIWQNMVARYNRLFLREAPNITLIYNSPVDGRQENSSWQFHIIFQPPLRDPSKLKYLAGFESGTNCIVNPIQPEIAAQSLRAVDPHGGQS